MKRSLCAVIITLLLLVYPCSGAAQPERHRQGRSSCLNAAGITLEQLDLTGEQMARAVKVRQAYLLALSALQKQLMSKRIELQSAFKDPQTDEFVIRQKAREVVELENQRQSLIIDYQLQIRGLLTAEQLKNWCAMRDEARPPRWWSK